MRELPMFPLGTVLFPHMVLPLHVFEPRYRTLMRDVLDDGREFGVVLISHGHEVGGGDERTELGTVARIVEAEELEDGRWLTIAVGTSRFRVERWLDDDPYPRAEVVDLDDGHLGGAPDDEARTSLRRDVLPLLRRVLAKQAELEDGAADSTFELAEDPEVACWQPAIMAPLTAYDAQRVLAAERCTDRLDLIGELLGDLEEALDWRLQETDG